jgi:hypothetical protein
MQSNSTRRGFSYLTSSTVPSVIYYHRRIPFLPFLPRAPEQNKAPESVKNTHLGGTWMIDGSPRTEHN